MRVLLELEVATKTELLQLVAQERERASGPAMRVLGEVEPNVAGPIEGQIEGEWRERATG
jgi:hypothetical protein